VSLILILGLIIVNSNLPEKVLSLGERFDFGVSVIGFSPKADVYLWTDSLFYEIDGDSCYHFIFYTKMDSTLPIPILESKIESYARKKDLASKLIKQYLREKSKIRYRTIKFDIENGKAYYLEDSTIFLENQSKIDSSGIWVKTHVYTGIYDMVDIFWRLRLINFDSIAVGDTFYLWSFSENRRLSYRLPIVVLREEKIKVPAGEFDCYVVNCCVRKTKIFSANSGDITLWISKAEKRIIVQMTRKERFLKLWQTIIFKLKKIE
jgi:hypothetical protein